MKKEKTIQRFFQSIKTEEYAATKSLFFCILAPSWDVYTDLAFTIQMIKDGNPLYAVSSVVPQLINIFFTFFSWRKWEQENTKRWSWVLVSLQCWPQFFAARIILKIRKGFSPYLTITYTLLLV